MQSNHFWRQSEPSAVHSYYSLINILICKIPSALLKPPSFSTKFSLKTKLLYCCGHVRRLLKTLLYAGQYACVAATRWGVQRQACLAYSQARWWECRGMGLYSRVSTVGPKAGLLVRVRTIVTFPLSLPGLDRASSVQFFVPTKTLGQSGLTGARGVVGYEQRRRFSTSGEHQRRRSFHKVSS